MRNSSNKWKCAALVFVTIMIAPYSAVAKPEFLAAFLAEYPEVVGTRLESCNVCHTNPPRRNPYGTDFNLAGRVFSSIESFDSDRDGADNLSEIMGLTFPGDASDGPNSTPIPTASPTLTAVPTPTILPGACHGDCNGNGAVAINEVILAVNIALGEAAVEVCSLADDNDNDQVSINELIDAVNRMLYGCPPQ